MNSVLVVLLPDPCASELAAACTLVPGCSVSVEPAGMTTSPCTMYGLPAAVQVWLMTLPPVMVVDAAAVPVRARSARIVRMWPWYGDVGRICHERTTAALDAGGGGLSDRGQPLLFTATFAHDRGRAARLGARRWPHLDGDAGWVRARHAAAGAARGQPGAALV